MASGKSTIGRALARELGKDFYDTDAEIIKCTGVAISLIFELEGEEGFRKRETEKLTELSLVEDAIIATGGGTILSEENRQILKNTGHIIYLQCTVNQQLRRTRYDTVRPLLQTENPRKKLEELMQVRGPLYDAIADILVSTEQGNSKQALQHILQRLKEVN
jgi:shikimate kinase